MKPVYLLIPGILGLMLFAVGLLFKLLHWPLAHLIYYSGIVLVLFSAFLLLLTLILKNKKQQ